jgi:hypothetical protein
MKYMFLSLEPEVLQASWISIMQYSVSGVKLYDQPLVGSVTIHNYHVPDGSWILVVISMEVQLHILNQSAPLNIIF